MLLSEITWLEFVQNNWVVITAAVSGVATAMATAFVYCVRAVWINAALPFIMWCKDKYEQFADKHFRFLENIESKVGAIVDTQDDISHQIGNQFDNHKVAINHAADGIIAHVDGKAEEAKQLANKAKEAVR